MGKFSNDGPGVGKRLAPDTYTQGDSGFAAMGKPVPFYRQQVGYEHCKAMGLDSESAFSAVRVMSEQLQRDKPAEAMESALKYLDVTGVYRLMAVLLAAEKPA